MGICGGGGRGRDNTDIQRVTGIDAGLSTLEGSSLFRVTENFLRNRR